MGHPFATRFAAPSTSFIWKLAILGIASSPEALEGQISEARKLSICPKAS